MEHELPVFDGFSIPEQTVRNNEQTVQEQPRTVVEQGLNSLEQPEQRPVEQSSRTIVEQPNSATTLHHRTIENRLILTVPPEDVQQWRHYAKIYYRRSLKPSSSEETRERNKQKYLEYRALLETAGLSVVEQKNNLIIN